MVSQPSGTVTFLFSDIEGSTRLLEALGPEAYAAVLDEHRALVRAAFERHEGYEVDTEGDSFFVAFETAIGAAAAATQAQDALASHTWPGGNVLRVRMGLHTGQPLLAPPKYVGIDVHRAARIMAAAHGGQVLVSAATAALLEPRGSEPRGLRLRDLGEHRFKDLAAAERVYQIGETEFPPIRSLYRTNLPVPATPFLGRQREVASVVELLSRGDTRLVTLSGPGGTGKTRLALQAAAEVSDSFPGGVWWVPLAALGAVELVLPALAEAVDFEAGAEPLAAAAAALAGRPMLAVFDNAEHLLPAVASVLADLVSAVPSLRLFVTSRERLGIAAELVQAVDSMSPADCVDLFEARARAVGADVSHDPAVASLCEALDGLPLAIELVAARTRLFDPPQLLARLAEALDLPAGRDSDPRQRTLRTTIAWSHDLLGDAERELFARLSVFRGGCDFEAMADVCGATPDMVLALLDKSLIRRREGAPGPRFWMLETIREFALEQLEARDDSAVTRDRHADHYVGLTHRAAPHWGASPEKRVWVARLDVEQPNVRIALERVLERGDEERLARAVIDLGRYWYLSARYLDGSRWFAALASTELPAELRVRVDAGAAIFAAMRGDHEEALQLANASVTLWRTLEDRTGICDPLASLGVLALNAGDAETAIACHEEGLAAAQSDGDPHWEAALQLNLSEAFMLQGLRADALAALFEAERVAEGRDSEIWVLAVSTRGAHYVVSGEFGRALPMFVDAAVTALREGYLRIGVYPLAGLARLAVEHDRHRDGALLLGFAFHVSPPGEMIPAQEREIVEETKAELERVLGETLLEGTYARGAALTKDEVIALAESLRR